MTSTQDAVDEGSRTSRVKRYSSIVYSNGHDDTYDGIVSKKEIGLGG